MRIFIIQFRFSGYYFCRTIKNGEKNIKFWEWFRNQRSDFKLDWEINSFLCRTAVIKGEWKHLQKISVHRIFIIFPDTKMHIQFQIWTIKKKWNNFFWSNTKNPLKLQINTKLLFADYYTKVKSNRYLNSFYIKIKR